MPYEDDKKEGNTNIIEGVTCKDDNIVEEVLCEDDENAKKVISNMDEEALPLEESDKGAMRWVWRNYLWKRITRRQTVKII